MEFNEQEKLGVIKAIDQVIRSDDKVYEGESFFLSQLSKVVKFDRVIFDQARKLSLEEAIAILKEMPDKKKEFLAMMLNQAANSDGRVQEDELRTIHKIFTLAGMDFDDLWNLKNWLFQLLKNDLTDIFDVLMNLLVLFVWWNLI